MAKKLASMNKVGANQLVANYMILAVNAFHAQLQEPVQEINLATKMLIATILEVSAEVHTQTVLQLKFTLLRKTNALKNNSDIANPPTELGYQDLALNVNNVLMKEKNVQDGKKDYHYALNQLTVVIGLQLVQETQLQPQHPIQLQLQLATVYQTNTGIKQLKLALMKKVGANHQLLHGCMILVMFAFLAQQPELAQETNHVLNKLIAVTQDHTAVAHTPFANHTKSTVQLNKPVLINQLDSVNQPELGQLMLVLTVNNVGDKEKIVQDIKMMATVIASLV